MNSANTKLAASCIVAMLIVISISVAGLTTNAQDQKEGLVIDFGYFEWNAVWTEIVFDDEMDGVDALETACHMNGYPEPIFLDEEKTVLHSIKNQISLENIGWGFYTMSDGSWRYVEDPHSVKVKDYGLVCWARAAGEDAVVPGTDASGFTYYSYGVKGLSAKTGEPLKVVTLAPSLTEMVVAVGGLDLIVGTDYYSDYPAQIPERKNNGSISIVGGYTDPNYEWIIKLGPDIVFCDGGVGEHISMANKLRKSGINCVVTHNSVDINTLYFNMWIVASAMGLGEQANDSINRIRVTVNTVEQILGIQQTYRVFMSLSPDPSPWTAGSDTFINDIIVRIHGKNIFASMQSSWFMVAKELIHFNQPEFIIILYEGREISTHEEYNAVLDGLDPLWKETPAYRNGNIFVFSGESVNILSRPGPRLGEATELLAKALHPTPFVLKDPMDIVPKFFGSDYREYLRYQEGGA